MLLRPHNPDHPGPNRPRGPSNKQKYSNYPMEFCKAKKYLSPSKGASSLDGAMSFKGRPILNSWLGRPGQIPQTFPISLRCFGNAASAVRLE